MESMCELRSDYVIVRVLKLTSMIISASAGQVRSRQLTKHHDPVVAAEPQVVRESDP